MTIFVNYRRKDSEAITGRIGDRLAEHFGEKNVYRDVESIPVGVDFVTHLESAVAACKVFVVVIGPDWVSDRLTEPEDFVRLEIETALRRRIPIVPVLVEGAVMPTKAVLPESLRPMVRLQGVRVDAGSEFGLQMTGLLSDIENVWPEALWWGRMIRAGKWAAGVVAIAALALGLREIFVEGDGDGHAISPAASSSTTATSTTTASSTSGASPAADAASASRPPPPPPPPSVLVDFVIGHYRACGVRADGRVVCWGEPLGAAQPEGITSKPQLVAGIDDALQIDGDDDYFCARTRSGMACWGPDMVEKTIALEDTITDLTQHCVRFRSSGIGCWNRERTAMVDVAISNVPFALGRGPTPCFLGAEEVLCREDGDALVSIKGVSGAMEVGTSLFHRSCARVPNGVRCWPGALASAPDASDKHRATDLPGAKNVAHLAIGEYHACLLRQDGTVACWGSNQSGQLGEAGPESAVPVPVPLIRDVVELEVGGGEPNGGAGSTCARTRTDELWCWGVLVESPRPVKVDLTVR